jgi:hypothetical protein
VRRGPAVVATFLDRRAGASAPASMDEGIRHGARLWQHGSFLSTSQLWWSEWWLVVVDFGAGSLSLGRCGRLAIGCCGEALVFVSGVALRRLCLSWCVTFEPIFVLMVLSCVCSVGGRCCCNNSFSILIQNVPCMLLESIMIDKLDVISFDSLALYMLSF